MFGASTKIAHHRVLVPVIQSRFYYITTLELRIACKHIVARNDEALT